MARIEHDREDLFAELRSARLRWELAVDGQAIVAGIRSDQRLALYFGPDPAYHFDAENRLRRAFVGNCLYRTQGVTLARLRRSRTAEDTQLLRHDLTPGELESFLGEMRSRVRGLLERLHAGAVNVLRHAGDDEVSHHLLSARLTGCLSAEPPLANPFPTRRQ